MKPTSVAETLALAVVVTLVGWLAWRSLGWPLVHDAPLMNYVAWRIAEGAVPYRDLFDMNFPGVYLLHLLAKNAVQSLFGVGDGPVTFLLTVPAVLMAAWCSYRFFELPLLRYKRRFERVHHDPTEPSSSVDGSGAPALAVDDGSSSRATT